MSESDGESPDDFVIDPDLKEDLQSKLSEEQIIGMYGGGVKSEERIPIVEGWFPKDDEWAGKTILNRHQARSLALAKHLPKAFPEISPLEDFINTIIDDYEILLTSVEGVSREQQMRVLQAMFGGGSEEQEEARTAILTALAGKQGEGDD